MLCTHNITISGILVLAFFFVYKLATKNFISIDFSDIIKLDVNVSYFKYCHINFF